MRYVIDMASKLGLRALLEPATKLMKNILIA